MKPDLTWVSGWWSSSWVAVVSAKGQSQPRRSDEDSLEFTEELLGEEDMVMSRSRIHVLVMKLQRPDDDGLV